MPAADGITRDWGQGMRRCTPNEGGESVPRLLDYCYLSPLVGSVVVVSFFLL